MKNWLFLFCSFTVLLTASPFYQNPSPDNVYVLLEDQDFEAEAEQDLQFVSLAASTFIAQVIKEHPDYIETFAQDFHTFSPLKKSIFQNAFYSLGITDPRVQGNEEYPLVCLNNLDQINLESSSDLDLLVISYIATGNEIFLNQLLAFLNSDPELLYLVYEWNNRAYLNQSMEKLAGQNNCLSEDTLLEYISSMTKEEEEQFSLRFDAWECLECIKYLDPTVEKKISRLCQKHPEIDYLETIKEIAN